MQDEFLKDPQIGNIRRDIALMRALCEKALDIGEKRTGLELPKCNLARVKSGEVIPSPEDIKLMARWTEIATAPQSLDTLEKLILMTSEITRAAKRLHEIEEGLKLRLDVSEIPRFMSRVADILARHIQDHEVLKAITDELLSVAGGITDTGTEG